MHRRPDTVGNLPQQRHLQPQQQFSVVTMLFHHWQQRSTRRRSRTKRRSCPMQNRASCCPNHCNSGSQSRRLQAAKIQSSYHSKAQPLYCFEYQKLQVECLSVAFCLQHQRNLYRKSYKRHYIRLVSHSKLSESSITVDESF